MQSDDALAVDAGATTRCTVCRMRDRDELRYGEWRTKGKVSVHLFCLYFSRDLLQRADSEFGGISRFLLRDIKSFAARSRHSNSKCFYCNKPNATVFCAGVFCTKRCHLICAVRNGFVLQFFGDFLTFCNLHYPAVNDEVYDAINPLRDPNCMVCLEPLPPVYSSVTTVKACCCPVWFHTDCVRRFALSAGYYFGCLCCRETRTYIQYAREWGVYVPEREASWENKYNFVGLRMHHNKCEAETCHSVDRTRCTAKNPFLLCKLCGAFGIHLNCARSRPNLANTFACENCERTQEERQSQCSALNDDGGVSENGGGQVEYVSDYEDHDEKDLLNVGFYIESDSETHHHGVIVIGSSSDSE